MDFLARWASSSVLVTAVLASSAAAQHHGATLRGTITDSIRPLETAVVQVFGTDRSVTSSSSGTFQFDGLTPGRYWIRVRRIGYVPASFAVTLAADSVRAVSITLDPAPYRLADLDVSGGMTDLRYADYARRARGAWGRLYTRDDIQEARAFDLVELVQSGMPGQSRWTLEQVASARRQFDGGGGRYCTPAISINGASPWPGTSLRDYDLAELEAVEIYRHPGMTPIEFGAAGRCGLVVLWLH